MRWPPALRGRKLWWIIGVLGAVLLLDYGPTLWGLSGARSARYQIAVVHGSYIVRLDATTGHMEAFALGTAGQADEMDRRHYHIFPIAELDR